MPLPSRAEELSSTKPHTTVYSASMSSGTARLKRRLDDQGINYTNKRAVENFCLVRFVRCPTCIKK